MVVLQSYGGLTVGGFYKLVGEGHDYVTISYKGSVLNVPMWAFEPDPNERKFQY